MPFVRQSLSRTDTELDRCLKRVVLVISIAAITLAIAAASAGAHSASQSDAVIAWNANAGDAALAACIAPTDNPLHESRLYAMTHVAIHDALNAIESRAEPYAFHGQARKGASAEAAAAAAARDVLVSLLPQIPFPLECTSAGVASVEADYAVALSAIPNGRAKTRGLEVGREAAETILALRDGDGSDTQLQDFDYRQGTEPGVYRFTPGFEFAFAPGWRDVTPFVLDDSSQFRPGPPYRVTGRRYAADLNEVKRLGGDGLTTPSARTAEETEIARFWVESSPLQWNRITRAVSSSQRLDLWQQARLFGLLNLSMADGYVASFDTKYHYNYWRPVTAIQNADADGNRRTSGDSDWTPLVTYAPDPRLRLGARCRGRHRIAGAEALLRQRSHWLRDMQPDAARRHVQRRDAAAPSVHQLLPGGRGERALAHPRRISTSARPLTKESHTATRSATLPSIASCGRSAGTATTTGTKRTAGSRSTATAPAATPTSGR